MGAVFQKELKYHFSDLLGYIFIAFILLIAGVYCTAYNISYAYSNFEYVVGSMGFAYLIMIPVLTMRIIAGERRQKTDQLLLTAPVSVKSIVMGKYFSLLVMLAVPLAVICIYPPVLSLYGSIYMPTVYISILAFYFLGAALVAIGMFLSSLTENQLVALVSTFAVMLLLYWMDNFAGYVNSDAFSNAIYFAVLIAAGAYIYYTFSKNKFVSVILAIGGAVIMLLIYMLSPDILEGSFSYLLQKISVFSLISNFIYGMLDLTVLIFYALVACMFVFFTVQSIEKRRYS